MEPELIFWFSQLCTETYFIQDGCNQDNDNSTKNNLF